MAWRNHSTHKEETKVVRQALKKAGINAKVGHGRGTAWGWLHINIGSGQQFGEHTHDDSKLGWQVNNCRRCRELRRMSKTAEKLAQQVTGRHGEWRGEINISTSDHWNQSKKCSEPITHPNWVEERPVTESEPLFEDVTPKVEQRPDLQEGTKIYYGGDMANAESHGIITRRYRDKWGTHLDIKLYEPRTDGDDGIVRALPICAFSEEYKGHGGTRWVTEEAYQKYRAEQVIAFGQTVARIQEKALDQQLQDVLNPFEPYAE